MNTLRKKLMVFVTMGSLLVNSGCIYLVVGGIGAVGGYIVSPDTVEGLSGSDADYVWDSARETVAIMGLINEEDKAGGIILADVNGAKVTVTIAAVGKDSTKVTVKARKAYLPRISLAQDIFVKIMNRIEE